MSEERPSIDLLVFAAHPDDAEIGMGGTIVKHTRGGETAVVCDLTLAEMSSNGTVEERQREAQAAAKTLGLAERINLRLPDRGLRLEAAQLDEIVRVIRTYRPRIVAAPYWRDRHPDHVMCSRMVQEAVFSAKLRRYRPEWPAWTVPRLYFYFINDTHEPDWIVDVSDTHAAKMAALRAYGSQFDPPAPGGERVDTPLTNAYLERVEMRDRLLGIARGVRYAEGFVCREPVPADRLR
jgi:bacillithiol biosynthesis deacetylase BshB1